MRKIIHLLSTRKLLALALAIVMLVALVPFSVLISQNAEAINPLYTQNGTGDQNNSAKPETLAAGEVWTGKSVKVQSADQGTFGVTLSALGREFDVTQSEYKQYDVIFLLDASGSMTSSRLSSMVTAANNAFTTVLGHNTGTSAPYNRVAVVTFNTNAASLITTNGGWTSPTATTYSITTPGLQNATNIHSAFYAAHKLLG